MQKLQPRRLRLCVLVLPCIVPAATARAASPNWTAASGNWNTPANWSTGSVPASNDSVFIYPFDGVNRTITYDFPGTTTTLSSLTVGLYPGHANATTTFSMAANRLAATTEDVAYAFSASLPNASGSFIQSGGTNAAGTLYLGHAAGDNGSYSLSNTGAIQVSNRAYVGYSGNGSFTQTGGTAVFGQNVTTASPSLYLGYATSGHGSYVMNAGNLTIYGGGYVGFQGSGTFTLIDGNLTTAGDLNIGGNSTFIQNGGSHSGSNLAVRVTSPAGSTSSYTFSNGALSAGSGIYVNGNGTSTFTQTGGTATVAFLQLGNTSGTAGTSTYALSGNASLTATNLCYFLGNGTFTQSGGTFTVQALLSLGRGNGTSTYNLSSGNLSTQLEYIGDEGAAAIDQTGGTNSTGPLLLGMAGDATYTLHGTGALTVSADESIGDTNAGHFIQSAGTHTVANSLYVGNGSGGGTYTLSGTGSLAGNGGEYIGGGSGLNPARFDHTGGTNTTPYLGIDGAATAPATYALSGNGTLSAGTITVGGLHSGIFIQSGGNATASSTVHIGGGTDGSGTLTLTAGTLTTANMFIGSASANTGPGALNLSANGSLSITSNLTIYTGSTASLGGFQSLFAFRGVFLTGGTLSLTGPNSLLNTFALTFKANDSQWLGTLHLGANFAIINDSTQHAATFQTLQKQVVAGNIDATLTPNTRLAVLDDAALHQITYNNHTVTPSSIIIAPELLGDANADGTIDLNDLNTVLNHLGQSTLSWTDGNFDNAPTIDLNDLNFVLNNLGTSFPANPTVLATDALTPADFPTPEPASLLLVLPSLLFALHRRR